MKAILFRKRRINIYLDLCLFIFLSIYPFITSAFRVEVMGKVIAYMIFALALDLLWGYTGMLSMGHAVMFGIGAYISALSLAFQKGLPTFMQKSGLTEIPILMRPLENPAIAILAGIVLPAILAFIIGSFLFSSRVNGVFFTIITLAISSIFYTVVNNQQKYFGGYNGITGVSRPSLFGEILSIQQYYYCAIIVLIFCYIICRIIVNRRLGKTICAIRDNEQRVRFLGYNTSHFKVLIYVISSMLAGVAGMLYASFNSVVSPNDLAPALSTMVIIWCAIGGIGTLSGALFGTLIINSSATFFSEYATNYWQAMLGIIIVLFVVFLPNGLIGKLLKLQHDREVSAKRGKLGIFQAKKEV